MFYQFQAYNSVLSHFLTQPGLIRTSALLPCHPPFPPSPHLVSVSLFSVVKSLFLQVVFLKPTSLRPEGKYHSTVTTPSNLSTFSNLLHLHFYHTEPDDGLNLAAGFYRLSACSARWSSTSRPDEDTRQVKWKCLSRAQGTVKRNKPGAL